MAWWRIWWISPGTPRSAGGLRETTGPLTELVAEAAVEAGVDTVDLAIPDDIWVTADRTRLRRAIGQFLENAIRFGNERVMVVASEKSGTVRIEVHDDGEGVPPRYEQVIWEPFERGAYRLNSAVQGGGLGLSIARQVAIRHGGSAGYRRSMLLGGAVFWIELPGRGSRPVED